MRAWLHRHPLLANLVVVVTVVAPGYLRIEQILDEQQAIIDQACHDRRDQKIVLRQLVELSDEDGQLNLTGFPSFHEMPPEVQAWVRDLEAAANQSPNPSSFAKKALALLDVPDC